MSVRHLIVAGRTAVIGDSVARNVGPHWESAGFVSSVDETISKVPAIASKKQIYAIAFGGGYDDEAFGQIWDAAKAQGWPAMSWLRPDPAKLSKHPGFNNDEERVAYGAKVGQRVVDVLARLEKEGTLGKLDVSLY